MERTKIMPHIGPHGHLRLRLTLSQPAEMRPTTAAWLLILLAPENRPVPTSVPDIYALWRDPPGGLGQSRTLCPFLSPIAPPTLLPGSAQLPPVLFCCHLVYLCIMYVAALRHLRNRENSVVWMQGWHRTTSNVLKVIPHGYIKSKTEELTSL